MRSLALAGVVLLSGCSLLFSEATPPADGDSGADGDVSAEDGAPLPGVYLGYACDEPRFEQLPHPPPADLPTVQGLELEVADYLLESTTGSLTRMDTDEVIPISFSVQAPNIFLFVGNLVIPAQSLLEVTGNYMPIFVVYDSATIDGTIDVSSDRGGKSGPGVEDYVGHCGGVQLGPSHAGGGGGGLGGAGGDGGNGGTAGGMPWVSSSPVPGCPGQAGAGGAMGGPGGGSLGIFASCAIEVSGTIDAGGAGGSGATAADGGGGGGGSGGYIKLSTKTLLLSNAKFVANGGGGGGGATTEDGAPGADGDPSSQPANGGPGGGSASEKGGNGGAGGAGDMLNGTIDGTAGDNPTGELANGGGGGGGGAGIVGLVCDDLSGLDTATISGSQTGACFNL